MRLEPISEHSKQIISTLRELIADPLTEKVTEDADGWRYGGKEFLRWVNLLQESMQAELNIQRIHVTSPFPLAPRTFVLDEKISEDYQTMSQQRYDQGLGPPFAVIKFSCHSLLDPGQQSFMRIYLQIPIDGTFSSAPAVRAQQAISRRTHTELKALAALDRETTTILSGNGTLNTASNCAPPFVPLIKNSVGVLGNLDLPHPSKLIYDDVTKTMHISGFRGAYPMDTEPFSDETYELWGLAKPFDRLDWYLDSSDWTW
ncbi:hypothetical protein N7491_001764 [Penicillium cf. griseofulvum]|uniref:Uncharacterized protein n=1 Tax=Penicillium cf. griseofulvum TaxID=2972120 RepID=A0A9W9M959_9EURO|nr:hypothetical protein N7472_006892 [Penicillium cf. griseofulvum]KAJ5445682.1 hypothetical protein N7491_001764 [Penicillium cf. griseofulvum]